ncbi:MAG: cache domain-containing protein [Candidatus Shapirobacteria bacterium]|nr:cache domain-containing protein [Candidatus Shapirobacteria bacterium]MDD4382932.1 cache domain-containing protein [Candidatus Shapirobacteria bacterium]
MNKIIISNQVKIKIFFCFFGVLMGGLFWLVSCTFVKNNIVKNTHQQLVEVSDLKKNKIDSYFSMVESEAKKIANSDEAKYLLNQPLVSNEEIVKVNVDEESRIIIKEIENYINRNPNKKFDEFKDDPVFQKIKSKIIGLDGYISIENYQQQVALFNEKTTFFGRTYEDIYNSPELYKLIVEGIKNNQNIYGFYDFSQKNKKIIRKYLRITHIETKTGDGVDLTVVVAAAIDNYKMIKEVADLNLKFFEENVNKKDFNNLFLINPDGYVVYTNTIKEKVGSNLNWPVNQDWYLTKKFIEEKNNKEILFSDAYIDYYSEVYPEFLVLLPIYDQNKLLGYVALIKNMNVIFGITGDKENLGETGESYLVSRDQKLLISPLRNSSFDMFVQTIDTDNIRNCFSGIKNPTTNILINYNNERTIATNSLITGLPWCLITEIKESEVLDISFNKELFASIIIFLLFSLIGFLMTIRKEIELMEKEKIKKISKIENFFIKLKIRYAVLFSLIFTIGYFLFITSFFQGWKKAAFYNDIPDLVIIMILINLFFYTFKLKNDIAKKLIPWGSVLVILDKLIQIFFEEYNNNFETLPLYFWLPVGMVGFVGLFLIFYGFKKEMKL